jgi:hypothetical protein
LLNKGLGATQEGIARWQRFYFNQVNPKGEKPWEKFLKSM